MRANCDFLLKSSNNTHENNNSHWGQSSGILLFLLDKETLWDVVFEIFYSCIGLIAGILGRGLKCEFGGAHNAFLCHIGSGSTAVRIASLAVHIMHFRHIGGGSTAVRIASLAVHAMHFSVI